MKKHLWIQLFLISWLISHHAVAQVDSLSSQHQLNNILAYTATVNALTLGQTLFYNEQDFSSRHFSALFFATNALQHLPNLLQGKGFVLLGLQTATTVGFYLTKARSEDLPLINRALFVPAYNISLFASYTAYRDMRQMHEYEPNDWKPFGVGELLLAPYHAESITNAFVWGAALGAIALNLILHGNKNSVFTTGKTYLGNEEYHPWVALPLMIGVNLVVHSLVGASEEAHYRGVFFEQMQRNTNTFLATASDIVYFTVSHLPQYYITDRENLLIRTISTAAFSFLMNSAYRQSGLRTSSASHIVFNFFSSVSYYLLNGGVANQNNYLTFSFIHNF